MITFEFTAEAVWDLITSLVLTAFALGVGVAAKFRGPAKWYAIFGAGFGLTIAIRSVADALPAVGVEEYTTAHHALYVTLVALALVPNALWWWGTLGLLDEYGGRRYRWFGYIGVAAVLVGGVPVFWARLQGTGWPMGAVEVSVIGFVLSLVPVGLMGAAPLILAVARRSKPTSGQPILAAALAAYPIGFLVWVGVTGAVEGNPRGWAALVGLAFFASTVIGWSLPRAAGRAGLAVIATAGAFLALAVLSGLYWPALDTASVARVFEVLLVAYAVLRLQYLGIDAKVRFGISKSTLAAIFVAVIFLVSEGAQIVFGEDQAWLGLAAGAGLVFALAPLSRFADTVAARAVPLTAPRADGPGAIYKRQVLAAWSDGSISKKERTMLRHLREDLGLGAVEADAIERDAESTS